MSEISTFFDNFLKNYMKMFPQIKFYILNDKLFLTKHQYEKNLKSLFLRT